MVYTNLQLPATLIHRVNGKKYTLEGKLLTINEEANVATMRFGKHISKNIPLNEVYLNENFLDTLKNKGVSLWNKIKGFSKIIGGYLVPISEKGKQLLQYINTPINAVGFNLPNSFKFAPCNVTLRVAMSNGIAIKNNLDIDEAFAEAEQKEVDDATRLIKRVMKEYVKDDKSTLSEAYHAVLEHYYHEVPAYKAMKKRVLNEVGIASLKNIGNVNYGEEVNTKRLVGKLSSYIIQHLNSSENDWRTKSFNTSPIVWGAPGIGKTTLIKKAIKDVKEIYGENLDIVVTACAALKHDDFTLPDTIVNKVGQKTAIEVPKTWLPCYDKEGLPIDKQKILDDFYNSGAFKAVFAEARMDKIKNSILDSETGKEKEINTFDINMDTTTAGTYTGGILFFDEFGRVRPDCSNIIMNLMGDRIYGNLSLASNWMCIGASNRLSDDLKEETDMQFRQLLDVAKIDRFEMYTYVPTKEEWLEWARTPNKETGEQNIDEFLCAFIEQAEEKVWYGTFANGAFNYALDADAQAALRNNDAEQIGEFITDTTRNKEGLKLRTWTGRSWDYRVNRIIKDTLRKELFRGNNELYDSIFVTTKRTKYNHNSKKYAEDYDVKNIDWDNLEKALDKISEPIWYNWTDGHYNEIFNGEELRDTNRIEYFKQWIQEVVIAEAFGGKGAEAHNLPYDEYKDYNNFKMLFTPEQAEQIWTKGKYSGVANRKDDDILYDNVSDYRNTKYSKWKAKQNDIAKVIEILKNNMPFNLEKQLVKDAKAIENSSPSDMTRKQAESIISEFDIKLFNNETNQTETINFIGNAIDNENELITVAYIINTSKASRYIANVANWLAKLTVQTKQQSILKTFVVDIFKDYNQADTGIFAKLAVERPEDSKVLLPTQMIEDGREKYGDI